MKILFTEYFVLLLRYQFVLSTLLNLSKNVFFFFFGGYSMHFVTSFSMSGFLDCYYFSPNWTHDCFSFVKQALLKHQTLYTEVEITHELYSVCIQERQSR